MSKIVHVSQITITREEGPNWKAVIKGFSEPVFYGVHGGIKKFYGLEPQKEYVATLDHIIGGVWRVNDGNTGSGACQQKNQYL